MIAVGQEIFGEKFVPLVELMDVQKYWQLLNGCKIGIFNNDRQQAMGNINTLLALGAKVYIRRDTSMWDKYRSEGYQMFDVEELGRVNWKTVISYDEQVQLFNSDNYFRQNSNENRAKIWNAIFTDEV